MFKFFSSLVLLTLLILLPTSFAAEIKAQTIVLKKPPEALTQWYKPANKRQVWLHTMFRLRREVLAMKDYAAKGQQPELEKWSQKFAKDYRSIAEMVPQWEEYLYVDKLTQLQTLVKQQDYAAIPAQLKKISKSCMHCHDDFQTVSTLLYRTPDFSTQTIPQGHDEVALDYDEMMEHLSDSVNRINIAIKDGYYTDAHQAIAPLDKQLQALASHCSSCHKQDKQPIERIMSASRDLLAELAAQLQHQDKKAGRKLGEFAVKVCARCHAVHRLTADLKSIAE